ncbi:MAG TPA: DHH family phosphoesterase [Solirubrobacteraceae bacterium]|nr:DHH family phosphoesterase [Solirubrobacteraceae bacterium]
MPSLEAPETVAAQRDAVLEELRVAQRTVVVTHEHPDGDALGSLVAMQNVLTALGHDSCMFIGEGDLPVPYEYRFLPLDAVVSQAPADLESRTVIFLDCGNIERNPAAERLRPDGGWGHILNIDHHHDNTRFGGLNYVDPRASCTAEIVWDLARALEVTLTPALASALYVGLITDTGCFMYENTTARAHLMAGELIEAGVDVHAIYQQVYEGVPFGKLALLARGLANAERYDDGRLTASWLSAEDFAAAGAEESYSEGVIDHLRAVRGTAMAALARDRLGGGDGAPEPRVRKVSLRASDMRVDVSAIARAQGGGGHRAAAGFSTSLSWDELVAFLRVQLAEQLGRPSAGE